MAEEQKKTELELVAGLFRNTDKNGNIYYSGKSEGGDEFVMFRNTYWKEGGVAYPLFITVIHSTECSAVAVVAGGK